MTLLPRLLLSPPSPPAHLIALSGKDNIRHATHDGRGGGRVISDITFLLSTYLHSELPPSFSVSAAKWLASLCPDKCRSQGIFSPLCQQVRTSRCVSNDGGGQRHGF